MKQSIFVLAVCLLVSDIALMASCRGDHSACYPRSPSPKTPPRTPSPAPAPTDSNKK